MAKWYAWSEIRNGGEIKEIDLPANKGKRTVVTSRNSVAHGQEVTKAKLKCNDEEWDALIAGGSVRSYPPPEGTDDYTSPAQAFVNSVVNDRGDIDYDALMEMGLANPPAVNPPAEEIAAGA